MTDWIDVREDLPKNKKPVFVTIEELPLMPYVSVAELIDNTWVLSECLICGHAAILGDHQKITHWMDLPEPPK